MNNEVYLNEYEWKRLFSEKYEEGLLDYQKTVYGMVLTPRLIIEQSIAELANRAFNEFTYHTENNATHAAKINLNKKDSKR
jgi:hypothetical protein